jgi:threonine/homoserine/homoserine lactone efflux protein
MKKDDNPKWYYLGPIVFLAIGVSQLLTREQLWVGIVTIAGALFMALIAFRTNRRAKKRE